MKYLVSFILNDIYHHIIIRMRYTFKKWYNQFYNSIQDIFVLNYEKFGALYIMCTRCKTCPINNLPHKLFFNFFILKYSNRASCYKKFKNLFYWRDNILINNFMLPSGKLLWDIAPPGQMATQWPHEMRISSWVTSGIESPSFWIDIFIGQDRTQISHILHKSGLIIILDIVYFLLNSFL